MNNKLADLKIQPQTEAKDKEHTKITKEDKREVKREMKGNFQNVKVREAITNKVFEKPYEERTLFQKKFGTKEERKYFRDMLKEKTRKEK